MYLTKRESGENPEQTRYCKSYATFRQTFCHCTLGYGKAVRNGDKSGDLPTHYNKSGFRGIELLMNNDGYWYFLLKLVPLKFFQYYFMETVFMVVVPV